MKMSARILKCQWKNRVGILRLMRPKEEHVSKGLEQTIKHTSIINIYIDLSFYSLTMLELGT